MNFTLRWARRCIPGTRRHAGSGWKRAGIACVMARRRRCWRNWPRCPAAGERRGKWFAANKTILPAMPGERTTSGWRGGAGPLTAARWSRAVARGNAAASAPVSFGRRRDCATWMPWKKPATTTTGTNSGLLPDGARVKLRPRQSCIRLPPRCLFSMLC